VVHIAGVEVGSSARPSRANVGRGGSRAGACARARIVELDELGALVVPIILCCGLA